MRRAVPWPGALAFLLAASVHAQAPTFAPAEVGAGPLLCFFHPEDAEGRPDQGRDRLEVLYVVDPTLARPPRPVWRGDTCRPAPLARLGQDLVAFEHQERVWLVEPSSGKTTPALSTERETELVRVDGATLLVAERLVPQATTWRTGEARQRLFTVDVATRAATPLGEGPVERVLGFEGAAVWAIASSTVVGGGRHIIRIRATATELLVPLGPEWNASGTTWAVSPRGRWLALGLQRGEEYGERTLVVHDLVEGRVTLEEPSISVINPDPNGSALPYLAVWWSADSTLATFSGTDWAGRDLVTGQPVQVGLTGSAPSPVAPAEEHQPWRRFDRTLPAGPRGCFDLEHGLVRFRGDPTPVIDVLDRDDRRVQVGRVAVDDAGEWAVSCDPAGTFLIDGRSRARVGLLPGWSHDHVWLPRWP